MGASLGALISSCIGSRITGDISVHLSPVGDSVSYTFWRKATDEYIRSEAANPSVAKNRAICTTVLTMKLRVLRTSLLSAENVLLTTDMAFGVEGPQEKLLCHFYLKFIILDYT